MSSQELPHQQQAQETDTEPPSFDFPLPSSPSQRKSDEVNKATTSHSDNTTTQDPQISNPRRLALSAKRNNLEAKLADLQSQRQALIAEAKLPSGLEMPEDWSDEQRSKQAMVDANATIKEHIALLHTYNEIKDIGMGLMGLLAEKRQARVATVMEEFGMGEKD
ncbi:hypothetical protein DOTSEDRAFT_132200 [Dothistroma septosporum NZE10]|uniref:Swi5-domain-containing protein n=1 Tax=Dothistroma septosporum (strain NZE10 / CBS 128990) TaxID=675120 RepID=M2YMB8_DOTSN|nr:hypothetical protein DOTSEDRAFT_132200 [Dothistroma septosporum NZE10]